MKTRLLALTIFILAATALGQNEIKLYPPGNYPTLTITQSNYTVRATALGGVFFDRIIIQGPVENVVIDGVFGGGPGNWRGEHTGGFGITIRRPNGGSAIEIRSGQGKSVSGVTIKHIEIMGAGITSAAGGDGIYQAQGWANKITLQFNWIHDISRAPIISRYSKTPDGIPNWLVEYNQIELNQYLSNRHSEAWSDQDSNHMTVRYNRFADIEGTAIIAMLGGGRVADDWNIHDNIFYRTGRYDEIGSLGGNGAIGGLGSNSQRNIVISNNAFVNLTGGNVGLFPLSGSATGEAKNNLWVMPQGSVTYGKVDAGGNGTISFDPFINSDGENFTLKESANLGDIGFQNITYPVSFQPPEPTPTPLPILPPVPDEPTPTPTPLPVPPAPPVEIMVPIILGPGETASIIVVIKNALGEIIGFFTKEIGGVR